MSHTYVDEDNCDDLKNDSDINKKQIIEENIVTELQREISGIVLNDKNVVPNKESNLLNGHQENVKSARIEKIENLIDISDEISNQLSKKDIITSNIEENENNKNENNSNIETDKGFKIIVSLVSEMFVKSLLEKAISIIMKNNEKIENRDFVS